jgi:hypothetical protein
MTIIEDVFQPIIGKPAWNVVKGVGTTLTFEFGDPHLIIREPKTVNPTASNFVRQHFRRRSVKIRGEWHLWIQWCEWQAFYSGALIGDHSSSTRILKKVASELDGQALVNIRVQRLSCTTFDFDLGGKLETIPGVRDEEIGEMNQQWSLFEPDGMVLTLRVDGNYCYKSGKKIITAQDWIPLFPIMC